ncbi:HAD-IA family hydrolase [Rheinheimera sp.]|uniref:HAD family hydrolase n=1 Tax=Rheinheimera sp. TaxID=1869214 RepID=UPI00307D1D20
MFDLDGTLVDSRLDFVVLCQRLGWPKGTPILEQLHSLECPQQQQQAQRIIEDFELAGAKQAGWMPGAQQLLQQLAELQFPRAILTRNMRSATTLCCQQLQIPIELVVTRDDAPAKPKPDGLWQIAEALQLPVAELLYVGDYLFDLQTAANAGARSCLFRYGDNGRFAGQADYVVDDLLQLLELLPTR